MDLDDIGDIIEAIFKSPWWAKIVIVCVCVAVWRCCS